MSPSTRDQTPDTKTRILFGAANLLSKRGLQALSFENVATEAGLTDDQIAQNYADTEALIVDMCDRLGQGYEKMLIAGILDMGKVERLEFFLDFFFDLAEGHPMPENLETYDAMVAFSVGSPMLREHMCEQYRTLGEVIVRELAIAHPQLKGSDCEELSFLFVSMMHAHWSFVASLGYSREHSRLARAAFGRLIDSYLAAPPDEPVIDRPWSRDA